jgi:chemotaxis protein methyltransferase CheR
MAHLTQQERAHLRNLITGYSGLGESLQSDEALERAVDQRLTANRLDSMAAYWPLIQRRLSGEMISLVQLLTNKETSFFREAHQFEVLRDRILPELAAARKFLARPDYMHDPSGPTGREPLRLWSAGCSTGEEAYSLAITVLEYQKHYGSLDAVVLATDIDPDAVEAARRGRYRERAIRLVPADLLQRYFTYDGETYHVTPQVARLVRFQVYNLADERYPPGLSDLDVIFCRNVTIYFDQEARDRLNARLADALREGGYLFVASAETMSHNRGRLELFPIGNTFLFRKRPSADHPMLSLDQGSAAAWQPGSQRGPTPTTPHPALLPQPASQSQPRNGAVSPPMPDIADRSLAWLYRARKAFQRQEYEAALTELDHVSADQPVVLEVHTLRAAALLQQERLAEAEAVCQYLLAHDPWHIDAHFLMGLISYHQGRADAAIQSLKTAVYLQPEHRWAHFYLAEAYRALGLKGRARREYKNTLNILAAMHPSRQAPDLNLSGLDDDVLRQACQINLTKLQEQTSESGSGGIRA